MTTTLYSHPDCFGHDPGAGHPERPQRLQAVEHALATPEFDALRRIEAPRATREMIERVHPATFVDEILAAVPDSGHRSLDPDTRLSPGSGEAALRAVGGLCAAVDAVMAGEVTNAFCAVRPPGHHAEATRAMGFCVFSGVAIAAHHARVAHGAERVAVVDFDVHHGNGTQAIFEQDRALFYASSHQFPAYPGTGAANETGVGNLVNVPLIPGSGSESFREAYREVILPALQNFSPDLLMLSAGFDAHHDDPLCQLNVATEDFAWLTEQLVVHAETNCGGRIVSAMEGGYDLNALGASVAVHVDALMAA